MEGVGADEGELALLLVDTEVDFEEGYFLPRDGTPLVGADSLVPVDS